MNEIIGIDHIYISVSDLNKSEEFYDIFMNVLGFRKNEFSISQDQHIQYYNKYFGYVLRPSKIPNQLNDPYAVGLHHLCFRVNEVSDLMQIVAALNSHGIAVKEPQHFPEYAHDYYAIFITDPNGIRLEITNYRAERRERHDNW